MKAQAELDATEESREERQQEVELKSGVSSGNRSEVRYLAASEYPAWDQLVEASPQGSVFTTSWWLSAVGGTVRVLGYFKNGRLIAGIPLYFEKRLGMNLCSMPKLTQTLGPVLPPSENGNGHKGADEKPILCALATALSKRSIFFQAFHPSVQNWSPFYWHGFSQTSRATYIINLAAPDKLWHEMPRSGRQAIRYADQNGLQIIPCTPDEVWKAEQNSFAAQKLEVPHTIDYLRGLYRAAKERGMGECFAAVDHEQRVRSGAFMVWNRKRAYAIAMGVNSAPSARGAGAMIEWHMIQYAAARAPIFDFTGTMLEGVDQFFRSFGATQVQYSWIMKFPTVLKMYLAARNKI
jgi:hypothetical protein